MMIRDVGPEILLLRTLESPNDDTREHWHPIYTFIRRCEISILHGKNSAVCKMRAVNEKRMGESGNNACFGQLRVQIAQLDYLILEHCSFPLYISMSGSV
jgi:hypothetical protein